MSSFFRGWSWEPPQDWPRIKTIDMHTAGEPLRVITAGLPEIPGDTIIEKSNYFKKHFDHLRTGLIWEPRGHADMYGAIITPPVTKDGDIGVFFIHNDGYSTMCGHAIIAITTLIFETKLFQGKDREHLLRIDAPPGRITARAIIENQRVKRVFFENVPSFILHSQKKLEVPELGQITIDVAYGGAFYAFTNADHLGLKLCSKDYMQIIEIGRRIKQATIHQYDIKHPFNEDLSFLYGTIFTASPEDPDNHSRNVCVFADGEVDRSPTGTGVSARAAIHYLKGDINIEESISIESILGTCMDVKVKEQVKFGPHDAVIPEVSGTASIIGQHEFYFDPADPLKKGFIFR